MLNSLEEFQLLVDKLQKASGRIEKENILSEYKDNCDIKDILNFIYNPYIVTGISKKKISKDFTYIEDSPKNIVDLLSYIKVHNTGKQKDIDIIKSFISNNERFANIIEEIICKSLKLGIQPITLNKIYGNEFIPLFSVMLAEKYYDNPKKYLPEGTEFSLTEKLDGCRCICIVENYNPQFFTRQGQPIEGLTEIENEISRFVSEGVFDGELLLDNRHNLLSKDLYRATVKEVNKDGEKHNLIFNIFDVVGVEEFVKGECSLPYSKRRKQLDTFSKELNSLRLNCGYLINHIKILPVLYQGVDQTKIQYWLNKITSIGGEGVMINIDDAPYECKRTRNLLKVKKMQTMDLRCIDMEEGEGVNKGRLGALKVEFPAPDGNIYIVDVGGGFSFEQRDYYWNNPSTIINKIVEVQYFEVSQSEKGGYSLRFPVFKWVREDKEEPSVY